MLLLGRGDRRTGTGLTREQRKEREHREPGGSADCLICITKRVGFANFQKKNLDEESGWENGGVERSLG